MHGHNNALNSRKSPIVKEPGLMLFPSYLTVEDFCS